VEKERATSLVVVEKLFSPDTICNVGELGCKTVRYVGTGMNTDR